MSPAPAARHARGDRDAERPHAPGPGRWWHECWSFEFATPGGLGGFVQLVTFPNAGRAWWWTYVLGPRGLVVVRDHEVVPPRRTSLEIRAEALWGELVCETPMEHWGIGVEAFGVRLDEPLDGYRGEVGTRVAVGLDLEWELTAPAAPAAPAAPLADGYAQPGRVHGDVLLGPERIAIDGAGFRSHTWGGREWWADDGHRVALVLADPPLSLEVRAVGDADARGWIWRAGASPEPVVATVSFDHGADGLPTGARLVTRDVEAGLRVHGVAAVPIDLGDGPVAGLVRALCTVGDSGGRPRGVGWADRGDPGDPSLPASRPR